MSRHYFVQIACITLLFVCVDIKAQKYVNILEVTIPELQRGYKDGSFTASNIVRRYLERIDSVNKKGIQLNAIITLNPDADSIARQLDEERRNGQVRGPLHGIPVVLKDNIDTGDKMPTTGGSRALANSYPLKDSFVAQQLREAGAVILGKANLSEWANFRGEPSSSGWSAVGGQTRNPYILDRNPCGSSSGSAVAVAANLTAIAIGTETNGSIVCPSQANGIVGIKPTVGLVSRRGIIPISFTQDTPGPMARSVRDAAITLGVLVAEDASDSKTTDSERITHVDYSEFLNRDGLQGKRIGIYQNALNKNYKVDSLFYSAMEVFREEGATLVELEKISSPETGYHSFQVMLHEYKDGLNSYFASLGPAATLKSIDELIDFNKTDSLELLYYNQKYLEMAAATDGMESDKYAESLKKLVALSREKGLDKVMDSLSLDAIVAPSGGPAWKTDLINGDHFQIGSSSPAARAGYPNISVPMGFIAELPVGLSIFGRAWSEPVLLEIAYAFEQATLHRKPPKYLAK